MTPEATPKPYYDDGRVAIYHGDCREVYPSLVAASDFKPADVLVTDPPYGYAYSSAMGGKFKGSRIEGDEDLAARDAMLALWGDGPALVFGSWKRPKPVATRHVLTWEKGDHVGMGDLSLPWRPNTEEVYILGSGFEGHRGSSVLRINAPSPNFTPDAQRLHPTEKPVPLLTALLGKCPSYWTVIDPFMGSGSTLRAAKDLGHRAIGIEVDERYCEIAATRLGQEVMDFGAAA